VGAGADETRAQLGLSDGGGLLLVGVGGWGGGDARGERRIGAALAPRPPPPRSGQWSPLGDGGGGGGESPPDRSPFFVHRGGSRRALPPNKTVLWPSSRTRWGVGGLSAAAPHDGRSVWRLRAQRHLGEGGGGEGRGGAKRGIGGGGGTFQQRRAGRGEQESAARPPACLSPFFLSRAGERGRGEDGWGGGGRGLTARAPAEAAGEEEMGVVLLFVVLKGCVFVWVRARACACVVRSVALSSHLSLLSLSSPLSIEEGGREKEARGRENVG
jgi:hypothetical protein